MRKALAQNVNLVLFLCGFAALYAGIASLSPPVANIVGGSLVMGLSAFPYLRSRKH